MTPASSQAHRAASMAALMAAVLASSKLGIYAWTGSLIVALSAWDSTMDVLVSYLNHKIIKYARQSADTDHPYGHGKAESIASLGQGALIIGGAAVILGSSLQQFGRFWNGTADPIHSSWWTAGFFLLASLLSLFITWYLKHFAKIYNSPALRADSHHYATDVWVNFSSAIGVGLVLLTNLAWLDALLASLFAIYIGYNGIGLMRVSIQELMDQKIEDEVLKNVLSIIEMTDKRIVDVHNFRGRKSGHRYFFDFHVTLPSSLNFPESHSLAESIEENVKAQYDADVVVHTDPDHLPSALAESVALSRRPLRELNEL
jgi:ferrous-iron efflux pump FieF